ncbi:hypothetical protein T10_2699 [Trichinella papuae]|uniref:Uncharacterized protein n=1 Tax=Trichinella papuae TaxID=268474 RepID=A0A0V1MPY4_9BILA|nr:hypothetical protein T10_2699 [Trichinella papuae]
MKITLILLSCQVIYVEIYFCQQSLSIVLLFILYKSAYPICIEMSKASGFPHVPVDPFFMI